MKRSGDALGSTGVRKSGENVAAGGLERNVGGIVRTQRQKPPFRLAKDDSKPLLQDPILKPDPFESEQAVIRLPPFPFKSS